MTDLCDSASGQLCRAWFSEQRVLLSIGRSLDGVPRAEEAVERGLIANDPDDDAAGAAYDATGDENDAVEKAAELHVDVKGAVGFKMHHHGEPGFDIPCERGDDHVGPVADEVVERQAHGVDAVFELLDDVFLIAAFVGAVNDFGGGKVGARSDVEEVADFVDQNVLAFHLADVFA